MGKKKYVKKSMNNTLVWIPQGDRANPSSRLRVFEVADALAKKYSVLNVFPPAQITAPPEALVVQKVCTQEAISLVRQFKTSQCKCFYDLCDPIWMQDDVNRQRGWDVDGMIRAVHEVIVPTAGMQQAVARKYPQVQVRMIPDAVDLNDPALASVKAHSKKDFLRIGWIGTALNMEHLPIILGPLQKLNRTQPLILRLVTASYQKMIPALPGIPVEFFPWSLENYARDLLECDVILIPMPVNEWTAAKSANRLQLCWALGLPAIFSPLPSYMEMADAHRDLAFVATSDEEWLGQLIKLMDPDLRNHIGHQAREVVAREYSLEGRLPLWADALLSK
ncbi:MAG TPA: hypothetical protein DCZ95_05765 [Verrucomicrobia bacterium]|nr:MAG: hypothetical protein A2X46_09955 [Lentisphaerae bacterium GWF2_57_35]HBA83584.1 hypothetical protein [Verrucomicrobiota bacterium]